MSDLTEMAQRRDAALSELVELGMVLARDQQARALAAESAEEAQALGAAFNQTARAVRLALALEAKLVRDLARAAREAARADHDIATRAVERRKAQVRAALTGAVREEGSIARFVELCETLEAEALYDRFLEGPVETQIARLRARLGLPANDAAANPVPVAVEADLAEPPATATWAAPDTPPPPSPTPDWANSG